MANRGLETPPPMVDHVKVSYPAPWILLVTIDREKRMNSMTRLLHWQMHDLVLWFDSEPSLRVLVITGAGKRAFCVGQDLVELAKDDKGAMTRESWITYQPPTGFAGISRRTGCKPIVAAVNGFALGGGFELVLNCDLVVASPTARFGLPEPLRGLYAGAGGLPRLIRSCGLQISSELALTGRQMSAQEAQRINLVNRISRTPDSVVDEAVELARTVANLSPDAIMVTRAALREAWETSSVERAFQLTEERLKDKLYRGENAREGLLAFVEKRLPNWQPSKL